MTKIEWTHMPGYHGETWNVTTGCSKVSRGCKNCYAEKMHKRLTGMGQEKYAQGFRTVVEHPAELNRPARWRKPRMVFVNSMSDLFHPNVSPEFRQNVFAVMNQHPQHIFLVLTKRPKRMSKAALKWTPNIWAGTSVEDQPTADKRIPWLTATPAKIRFLSCEPLLSWLNLRRYLSTGRIHWVITGGESGPKARMIDPFWVEELCRQCQHKAVPFFFKQWGGVDKKAAGRLLNGREYNEFPIERYRRFTGGQS